MKQFNRLATAFVAVGAISFLSSTAFAHRPVHCQRIVVSNFVHQSNLIRPRHFRASHQQVARVTQFKSPRFVASRNVHFVADQSLLPQQPVVIATKKVRRHGSLFRTGRSSGYCVDRKPVCKIVRTCDIRRKHKKD